MDILSKAIIDYGAVCSINNKFRTYKIMNGDIGNDYNVQYSYDNGDDKLERNSTGIRGSVDNNEFNNYIFLYIFMLKLLFTICMYLYYNKKNIILGGNKRRIESNKNNSFVINIDGDELNKKQNILVNRKKNIYQCIDL